MGDLVAARGRVDRIAEACPAFEDDLVMLDCSEAPCHAHVWTGVGQTWSEITCGVDEAGTRLVDLSFSLEDDRMATWHVYALSAPAAIDLDAQRARAVTAGHQERLAQAWIDAR